MSSSRFVVLFLASLLLAPVTLRAAPETVWLIGVDEDPFAAGYNPTDEFSSENYVNDTPPGTIYTAANPVVDDDFYFAGTFPIGFNNLTTNRTVLNAETNRGWETRTYRRRSHEPRAFHSHQFAGGCAVATAFEF